VLYNAWLSSADHTKFTGSAADIDPSIGGKFTAWDGYISGTGTEVTIDHSGIPEGQAEEYENGWQEFYFDPMRKYYV
jgi:hypothetical protein